MPASGVALPPVEIGIVQVLCDYSLIDSEEITCMSCVRPARVCVCNQFSFVHLRVPDVCQISEKLGTVGFLCGMCTPHFTDS